MKALIYLVTVLLLSSELQACEENQQLFDYYANSPFGNLKGPLEISELDGEGKRLIAKVMPGDSIYFYQKYKHSSVGDDNEGSYILVRKDCVIDFSNKIIIK